MPAARPRRRKPHFVRWRPHSFYKRSFLDSLAPAPKLHGGRRVDMAGPWQIPLLQGEVRTQPRQPKTAVTP